MTTNHDNTNTTDDSFVPTEYSRDADMASAIDRMVAGRVNTETGEVEHLRTVRVESAHSSGDVVPTTAIPSPAEFVAEIQAHVARANDIQQQLDAQDFDPKTGKSLGLRTPEGSPERTRLQGQLRLISQQIEYTDARARQMLPLRAAQMDAQNAAAAEGREIDAAATHEAAKREAAIAQLAEQRVDGKPLGRLEATRMYDRAAAEALASKLARGK